MKLGSHNSFSYLKPKHWWMYPFIPIARCQSRNIPQQFNYGARWFDLRIRYNKDNKFVVAHGVMEYKADVMTVRKALNMLNVQAFTCDEPVYVRVIYEMSARDNSDKAQEREVRFSGFCDYIQSRYKHLKFIGGQRKYDWAQIHNFNTPEPKIIDKYSSMTWLKIDDWLPCLYAFVMNNRNWKKYKNIEPDSFMLADFVHRIKM